MTNTFGVVFRCQLSVGITPTTPLGSARFTVEVSVRSSLRPGGTEIATVLVLGWLPVRSTVWSANWARSTFHSVSMPSSGTATPGAM